MVQTRFHSSLVTMLVGKRTLTKTMMLENQEEDLHYLKAIRILSVGEPIEFNLPNQTEVALQILDTTGRGVATLVSEA